MQRIKNYYNASIGIYSDKHDVGLAIDIINNSPNLKMARLVEKPSGIRIVEVRGMRDDIRAFRDEYTTKLREKLTRENPELTYDQIQRLINLL